MGSATNAAATGFRPVIGGICLVGDATSFDVVIAQLRVNTLLNPIGAPFPCCTGLILCPSTDRSSLGDLISQSRYGQGPFQVILMI
jgi:hypothetical protein